MAQNDPKNSSTDSIFLPHIFQGLVPIFRVLGRLFKKSSFSEYQNQWIVLFFLCSISVILTPFFEIEAASSGARYSEVIFPFFMYWLENSSWVTFLIGVGLASGFLHYFMDRAVYRLSDAETRMSAKNLLFG